MNVIRIIAITHGHQKHYDQRPIIWSHMHALNLSRGSLGPPPGRTSVAWLSNEACIQSKHRESILRVLMRHILQSRTSEPGGSVDNSSFASRNSACLKEKNGPRDAKAHILSNRKGPALQAVCQGSSCHAAGSSLTWKKCCVLSFAASGTSTNWARLSPAHLGAKSHGRPPSQNLEPKPADLSHVGPLIPAYGFVRFSYGYTEDVPWSTAYGFVQFCTVGLFFEYSKDITDGSHKIACI